MKQPRHPDGRFVTPEVTLKPIHVELRHVELDVYWNDGMVADVRYGDHELYVDDPDLIKQIINDNGVTADSKRKLGL